MANTAKKASMRALVEVVLTDLMVKNQVDNVYLDDGTTLAAKLAEMVAAINDRTKSADVTAEISAAIDALIGGAPETYDTLKEIADHITAHGEADLEAALAAKVNAAAQGNHSHANKAVLDGVTVEKVSAWDGKGTVFVQAAQPAGLAAGDLWLQTLE